MRVAILGGGAMGGLYAAAALEAGHSTVIVDPSTPLVEAIERKGLLLREPDGAEQLYHPTVLTDASDQDAADVAVIAVKSHHTVSALDLAGPLVGPQTTLVTLQNGWGNAERARSAKPANPLVLGVAYSSATTLAPAHVHATNRAPTIIGADGEDDQESVASVVSALDGPRFQVTVSDGIHREIWSKLVLNAAVLSPTALTGMAMGAAGASDCLRPLIEALAHEAVVVGNAAGFGLDGAERIEAIFRILRGAGPGRTSMHQDIEAGRPTEVSVVNGAVCEMARRLDLDVPVNRAMVALIEAREAAS